MQWLSFIPLHKAADSYRKSIDGKLNHCYFFNKCFLAVYEIEGESARIVIELIIPQSLLG